MSPTPRLRCVSWIYGTTIHCKWHDSCSTLWRILPLRVKRMESSRRTLLINEPQRRNIQQWRRAHHILHNQKYNGISFKRRTGCHVLQFLRSHSSTYHVRKMGHPQPPTNVTVDNSMAHRLTQGTMVPKKIKAMDMRFYWLNFREAQVHIRYLWRRGKKTLLTITQIITHPNIIETCAQNTWHSTLYMNVSITVGSIPSYYYFILQCSNESTRVCCSHPSCNWYSIEYWCFSRDSEH